MKIDNLIDTIQPSIKRVRNILYDAKPWIALSTTALSTPLASSAIQKIFEKLIFGIDTLKQNEMWPNVLYIALFFISIKWLYSLRSHLFKARTQGMQNVVNPELREHLILFLSNIPEAHLSKYTKQLIPNGLSLVNKGLQSLDDDLQAIKAGNSRWSWEMTLRAIRYHIGKIDSPTLKTITVICSPESIEQFPQFRGIVENYLIKTQIELKLLAKKDESYCWDNCNDSSAKLCGYDFEDFDELTTALYWCIKQHMKKKIKEKDIMIDFTGGMKVTSVVAATLTFNSNIKAQYISTITSQVKGYDVNYGTSSLPSID